VNNNSVQKGAATPSQGAGSYPAARQKILRKLGKVRRIIYLRLQKWGYSLRKATRPARKTPFRINLAGTTRASWESTFLSLWEPLLPYFSPGKAFIHLDGPRPSSSGRKSDGYEGFARSFIGAAFYLHHKESGVVTLSDGSSADLAAIYREGIVSGTTPGHREFWGKIKSNQRLVENGAVAMGLLLTRRHIWDRLSPEEKDNVAAWFQESASQDFWMNSWQWFKVFHYLFLEKTGYEYDPAEMARTLDNIERMYCRDGWYTDGVREEGPRYDYYVAWAMHFYSLMFCYLAGENHRERQQQYLERSRRFAADYRYFFTPHGHPPLYGRSQLYRFASLAPWGPLLWLDASATDLAWLKTSAIDTLNTFLERGAVGKDGVLSMGYYGEFTPMLEAYSGPASPYWAFKGFSFLLLPEGHGFWAPDIGKASPKELVYPVEATEMVLLHAGDAHVVLLQVGANADYPMKYDKFAYSNTFLMNYDPGYPIDNTLMLRSGRDRWSSRRTILESYQRNHICHSRWKWQDTIIRTTLVGRRDGYVAVHQLYIGPPCQFQTGGFPLAQNDRYAVEEIAEGAAILKGEKGQTGIKLLAGEAQAFVYRKRGVNPAGEFSSVPCLRGTFGDKNGIIVIAVGAAKSAGPFELPLVKVEKQTCTLRWPDSEQPIALD
jgi:hypothetical protein